MSSFTEASYMPTGAKIEGREVERVVTPFYYEIGYLGSGLRVYVNAGTVTDNGSIPGWSSKGLLKLAGLVTWMIPKKVLKACKPAFTIHDILREDERFTLLEGNAIFLMAMEGLAVPKFWRDMFYLAVSTNSNREKHNALHIINGGLRAGSVVTVAR